MGGGVFGPLCWGLLACMTAAALSDIPAVAEGLADLVAWITATPPLFVTWEGPR